MEEDLLWTLCGVQTLVEQQHSILEEYRKTLTTLGGEGGPICLTMLGLGIVKRDLERREVRRIEMQSLKEFQRRMDRAMQQKENILYDLCNL